MVEISAYYSDEKKMEAARRWLWWRDHRLTVIGIALTVIAIVVGAVVTLLAAALPFILSKPN